jgi:hypothetical protein
VCNKCTLYLPEESFGSNSWCKGCQKEYRAANKERLQDLNKSWRLANNDKMKEYSQEYYSQHKDSLNLKCRENYALNRAARLQYRKNYVESHKDAVRSARREWGLKNREYCAAKARERHKIKYRTDEVYNIITRLRARLRLAVKEKSSSTRTLTGCSWDSLIGHLKRTTENDQCDIRQYHVDHILPVNAFDMSNPWHQELCFHYSNLQLLLPSENLKKSSVIPAGAEQLLAEGWTIEECAMYQRDHPACFGHHTVKQTQ